MKALTGLPVNYLMTVNFRGFRQIVDRLGGVWMDVDRRYYNDQGGPYGYATINLQPGYQKLTGYRALDFVRFRHTDSDLFRVARQQQFVRALKDQIDAQFSVSTIPRLVKAITSNVEVGQGGGKDVDAKTVLRYAALAYTLPPGHVFQVKIDGLEGFADLTTDSTNIQRAVQQFTHPDVASPKNAAAVALGQKVKAKVPPPRETTVTVLNGNGETGSASNARLPARPARIPDRDSSERHSRQRAELRVLPDDRLLRSRDRGCQGRRPEGGEPVRLRRRDSRPGADQDALERRHARGRGRQDLPRESRVGAGRPDPAEAAGERHARHRGRASISSASGGPRSTSR